MSNPLRPRYQRTDDTPVKPGVEGQDGRRRLGPKDLGLKDEGVNGPVVWRLEDEAGCYECSEVYNGEHARAWTRMHECYITLDMD